MLTAAVIAIGMMAMAIALARTTTQDRALTLYEKNQAHYMYTVIAMPMADIAKNFSVSEDTILEAIKEVSQDMYECQENSKEGTWR